MIRDVYLKHYDEIYQYILFLTNKEFVADDFVQETFIRYGRIEYVREPRAMLYKIARNLVYDYSKRKKLLKWVPIVGDQYRDENLTPEQIRLKGEEIESLYKALSTLPIHYREVIVLRYIEELSVHDVAKLLELTEVQVKNYTARGFKQLRAVLGGEYNRNET